jgi:hypothetical protein
MRVSAPHPRPIGSAGPTRPPNGVRQPVTSRGREMYERHRISGVGVATNGVRVPAAPWQVV